MDVQQRWTRAEEDLLALWFRGGGGMQLGGPRASLEGHGRLEAHHGLHGGDVVRAGGYGPVAAACSCLMQQCVG